MILAIVEEAARIARKRQEQYGDHWRKYGWRGALFNLRRKAERAFDHWWNRESARAHSPEPDVDDLFDAIIYAAIAIAAIREENRDGEGGWW